VSPGTRSPPASRSRTASSRASKAGFATNASTRRSSPASPTLIGPSLRSRTFDRQKVEAAIAVRCINRFTALGMPKTIRIE
jgi:hypothetical protein